jgi:hypothetical protein
MRRRAAILITARLCGPAMFKPMVEMREIDESVHCCAAIVRQEHEALSLCHRCLPTRWPSNSRT